MTIIADLHLSAGPGDDFAEDRALVRFLDRLAKRAQLDGRGSTLVILGDLVDFSKVRIGGERNLDRSAESALAKLDVVASAHREVFAALGRAAAAGLAVELVAGNHDAELVHPEARDRLSDHVAAAAGVAESGVSLRVHPWFLHLPGVLHAEHGQQHHDINRMPGLFAPGGVKRGGGLRTPLGIHVAHFLNERDELSGRPLRQAALAARCLPAAVAAGVRMFRSEAPRQVDETSLPGPAPARLAAVSTPTARGFLGRILRGGPADGYMRTAATRIDRILSECGAATPFYAFGHTHIAADRLLAPSARGARYLNPGSWSVLREAGSPPRYVELDPDPDRPRAALLTWDEESARQRTAEVAAETRR